MDELKDIILNTHLWPDLLDRLLREAINFGAKLLICLVIYWVGRKLIRYLNLRVES
ncbi:MAG: hypothetical protein LBG77_01705 [Dysgonamonadaceae bacterium]|jgi:small conductance mechanosensitive channel|nr:hypothetical protein [Dysgonamonadaceae bacterium]